MTNTSQINYYQKYLKYKNKYINLKNTFGGVNNSISINLISSHLFILCPWARQKEHLGVLRGNACLLLPGTNTTLFMVLFSGFKLSLLILGGQGKYYT